MHPLCCSPIPWRAAVTLAALVAFARTGPAFCAEIQDAVKAGDLATVTALLKDSPDLMSKRDGNGHTLLHLAAIKGRLDVAKGRLEVAEFLLNHGAGVDLKDKLGMTPLHLAASFGQLDVANLLLANGADVNAKIDAWFGRGNVGYTPLHFAAVGGHKDVVELLLNHGADVNARDARGCTPAWLTIVAHRDISKLLRQHGGHN